ncbi:MAG: aldehyde dehydrogenase (NADP(+)) [Verrucomicrobia bacterium]|nr:aldehyde dehydrogenase (NADP(+)) [Verrucomicrobiota bacterium]
MTLQGTSIIGNSRGSATGNTFCATNPATRESLAVDFHAADTAEVDRAASLAGSTSIAFGATSGRARAALLRAIADKIEKLGDVLVERATAETGLPEGRIQMERGRTCGQLRLFAAMAEDGSWVEARVDHGDPNRQPLPKPDVRSMLRPVGPVAVFCASNFPLAFSVAGGDTAAALAAGCPVVVKAHHAHPGTAELVGTAVAAAVASCGLPEGVFSLLFGSGREVGSALVIHPSIKAVGFTGSRAGGRALMDLAAARPEPIPVYAEMSSINPVFILPGALAERAKAIAVGLHGSVTMGVGQFCTNPGLVMLGADLDGSELLGEFCQLMSASPEATMLTGGICQAYRDGVAGHSANSHVRKLAAADATADVFTGAAAVFEADGDAFLSDASLKDELFGPATLIVRHSSIGQLLEIARALEGQLTVTIQGTEADLAENAELLQILETKTGRLLFNGFPTGVEVCHAMVHGGPYPATSDGRSTSVGTQAVFRFTRPVCYQNWPDNLLPEELREANPLGISRLVDGVRA